MKSIGKILGLLLLGLLLILVALGFALTHLFDPNDYKDEIRQIARDKANIELTLNGDIGWSLFPWLGLELHQASVANLATPEQAFADLDMLGLSVRVLPLLRKEVQMSDIRIEGLKLSLVRDKQGHGNWEDIGQPASAKPPANSGQPPAGDGPATSTDPGQPSQPVKLDIDSLIVNNARIDYRDERSGQQLTAESIQLTTGAIREGAGIPLKLTAFLGTNQPLMRARTELQGELRFDRALMRYQLENMRLSGEASGQPLDGKTATFSIQGQLLLDQAAQIAEWNSLKLSFNQLRALGELNLRELDKTPKLAGTLSIAELDLRQFLTGLGQKLPETADANTLKKLELVSRLEGSPTSLAFEDLKLKLDDSSFEGRLALSDLQRQALRIQLKGDQLDLDRYLPAKAAAASDAASASRQSEVRSTVAGATSGTGPLPPAPTQHAWSDVAILPLEPLRQLDLQLELALARLTLDKLPIDNASLKAKAKGGLLNLQELRGGLYNGSFKSSGTFDLRTPIALLNLQAGISGVPVEKLLEHQGEKSPVTGSLELNADLRTSGNSQKAWVEGLGGNASFALKHGVLLDANLEQQLCQGIALLNRKSLSNAPRGKDTAFQELRGSLVFNNGVASNPDLSARIPGLTVKGNGDLDLRVLGMDYHLGIVIEGDKGEMPDPACAVNQRYVGLEWPVQCRGPLELGARACRLDQNGLGKIAAKLAGDKLNEKIEEKLGDKVSPELKDALKGLFKR